VTLGVFAVTGALAIGSALGLIVRRNPIHGALFLIVHLASIAVLYLLLGAEFLAWAQVIIYAGAIMVLFVFALMVLIPGREETGPDPLRRVRLVALPFAALFLLLVLTTLVTHRGPARSGARAAGGVEAVGRLLFTEYLFPFELTSVLLLGALVGVLALAKRRPDRATQAPEAGTLAAGRGPAPAPDDPAGRGDRSRPSLSEVSR
jgi:NADH-quinone oxidoreductase subunit J